MKEATALFRLLGDEARLRILRLLDKQRLNVSELTAILAIAQPGVSRHLRLLKEGGLVEEERDRGWSYYGLISSSGALIEEVDPPLLSGGKIALSFTPFDDSKPIELRATIVRETDTGFAVEFDELDVPTYKILRTAISEAIRRSQEESAAVKRRAAPR